MLNVVHKPAILRLYEYRIAIPKYGEVITTDSYSMKPNVRIIKDILETTIYPPLSVETNLFYFNCEAPKGMIVPG